MHQLEYLITFICYFLVILAISTTASRRTRNLSDYVLGGRSLSGPITALGAGASDMSGWLLLALPGAVFLHGLNQIWLPVGLSIGAYLNWKCVAARLRNYTEVANDSLTIPAYFDHRFKDNSTFLRLITALIILIFFTFYAAAGFVSGALLFKTAFHLSYLTALWSSACLIMLYTAIGGFLAINWIDFFQGSLMFFALAITPIVTFAHIGSWHVSLQEFTQIGAHYLQPLHGITIIGTLSLLAWGLGYFGQPHILVRFMAVKSSKALPTARRICMGWMMVSLLGAIATGLFGHAYLTHSLSHPESIFLVLAETLFNPWVAGILLAAVLSAIMSTISSQLLAASSALTADIYQRFFRRQSSQRELVIISRATVILIALVAILLASNPHGTILALVGYAWGGLGASFGPIVLFSLFWSRMTRKAAIAGMMAGALTIIIWKLLLNPLGGFFTIYEIIPGFIINSLVIIIVSLFDKKPSAEMQKEFNLAKSLTKKI